MKKMRLPNGFGQISRIRNKRLRNQFRAMVTVGNTPEGYKRKIIGYFPTYNDAYKSLIEYHDKPVGEYNPTLQKLFDEWFPDACAENGWSETYSKGLKTTFEKIASKDLPINTINANQLRQDILSDTILPTRKAIAKIVLNSIYNYAIAQDIVTSNPISSIKLPKSVKKQIKDNHKEKVAFTLDELKVIKSTDSTFADALLYNVYSGWRSAELVSIKKIDVNLAMGYIVGGCKTDYGKNRIVPIHPYIRPIVERYMKTEGELLFGFKTPLQYAYLFKALSTTLGKHHSTHDCRKTFISFAKASHIDEYALKRIVGHSIADLTESVYTERPIAWLIDEMKKVKILDESEEKRAII